MIEFDELLERERDYDDPVTRVDTLNELFQNSVERHRDQPAQLYKGDAYNRSLTGTIIDPVEAGSYGTITYGRMGEMVRRLGLGFRALGVNPGDRIGMLASTRMEWALCDWAVLGIGGAFAPIYTESSPHQIEYLLNDSGAAGLIVENSTLLTNARAALEKLDLEFVVMIDEPELDHDLADVPVFSLEQVYERGERRDQQDGPWTVECSADDRASLIYTSGTTGQPKGVRLTHGNFVSNIRQTRKRFGPRPDKPDDLFSIDSRLRILSFLPLAHVFERMAGHFLMFASGVTVGYAQSPLTLIDDIKVVQPTAITSVPRIYEKVYERISSQAARSTLKNAVFEWSRDVGIDYSRTEDPGILMEVKHWLADRLMFRKVKQAFGGKLKYFFSGGGSLPSELAEVFQGMGLSILEGYGLTETSPVVSANPPEEPRTGSLGLPVVNQQIKLDTSPVPPEVQEKRPGTLGELLVKGPHVTEGYWNKPEETERSFTEDGWFRTGDMVEQSEDGFLTFVERIKQIIVLSSGKNVAPRPIESAFATSNYVLQIMVLGDEQKYITALIRPNFEALERRARTEGLEVPDSEEALIEEEYVQEWIHQEIKQVNQELENHERIKDFRLVSEEWTPENEMLTPSMKLKRRNLKDRFGELIESMY